MRVPMAAGGSALLLGSDFKALAAARSLSRLGVRVTVVDSDPRSAWYSRHVARRVRWHSSLDDAALVDRLLAGARDEGMAGAVVFPMQDEAVELVSRHHRELSAAFVLTTAPWDRLRRAHQKTLMYEASNAAGVRHPMTWMPANEEQLRQLPIVFPAIIKPAVSPLLVNAIRRKALLAEDWTELLDKYRLAARHVSANQLLVQEFIPGGGEQQFSYCALSVEGTVLTSMTARRLRQYPIDFGMSSSFVEAVEVPELEAPSKRLLTELGLSGILELEYKRHPISGEYHLLDINVRPWAWHGLCTACGVDFIELEYRRVTGGSIPATKPRYDVRWRRFITDVPAGAALLRAGQIGLGAYMRSLRGRTASSVFELGDPLPALADVPISALRVLRRRRRRSPHATVAAAVPETTQAG